MPVSALHPGDRVFTIDLAGVRVVMPVRAVRHVPIVGLHDVVELELADRRIVRASPGHPTSTGASLGALGAGSMNLPPPGRRS